MGQSQASTLPRVFSFKKDVRFGVLPVTGHSYIKIRMTMYNLVYSATNLGQQLRYGDG